MRSHPPSGPRAGRNSGPGRLLHRGGVQKRSQQSARVDRDGDLDMDSSGAGRGRGRGRGRGDRRRHTPTPQMNGHGNPFSNTQRNKVDLSNVQKGIFQAMGVKGSTPRGRGTSSRFGKSGPARNNLPSGGLDQIVIRGLQQSKAAANADGGLEALITWLERKATSPQGEMVKVKKVCLTSQSAGSWYQRSFALSGPLSFHAKLSERRPRYPSHAASDPRGTCNFKVIGLANVV